MNNNTALLKNNNTKLLQMNNNILLIPISKNTAASYEVITHCCF